MKKIIYLSDGVLNTLNFDTLQVTFNFETQLPSLDYILITLIKDDEFIKIKKCHNLLLQRKNK